MAQLLSTRRTTRLTVFCLLAYAGMKGYSFFTGANGVGWEVPRGRLVRDPQRRPDPAKLNLCVGVIVACTMYAPLHPVLGGEE